LAFSAVDKKVPLTFLLAWPQAKTAQSNALHGKNRLGATKKQCQNRGKQALAFNLRYFQQNRFAKNKKDIYLRPISNSFKHLPNFL